MKTAVLTVKVSPKVKEQAQKVAKEIGIPLSTLVNAYLVQVGNTGQISFSASEEMTEEIEEVIEKAEEEIDRGEVSGPFKNTQEALNHLDSLK